MKTTAFLTGVGIGTAVGILIAQQSGRETRQKMSHTVEQGKRFVSDKMAETVAKVTDAAHDAIDSGADRLSPSDAGEPQSVAFPRPEAQAS